MPKQPEKMRKFVMGWLTQDWAKGWLERTSDTLLRLGSQEAWCKLCRCAIRPHKSELLDHIKTKKHKAAADACPTLRGSRQATLLNHGISKKTEDSKIMDLKLAAHNACHSSIRTIDHMGVVLKSVGQGSVGDLRLHRTKCSRLICKVIAPCMLRELIADIGDGWYSLIVDESTDTTTIKHMALMVRYYSHEHKDMLTDFLGLVETPRTTAEDFYSAVKAFLGKVGLNIKRLFALGTDGASNLCGANHPLYALLKRRDCPDHLVKCICHALDKCSSKASSAFPGTLEMMVRETRNWFSHSALRRVQYQELYESLTGKEKPPHLVRLATTRWLSWYGAVKSHLEQYDELRSLFHDIAAADVKGEYPMVHHLAALHEDGDHRVYLTFLRPVLREIASINVAFQKSGADISQAYKDFRVFIDMMARRIQRPEAIRQTQSGPGMVSLTEMQALKAAIVREENFLPVDRVNFGDGFYHAVVQEGLGDEARLKVQTACKEFLKAFVRELLNRLPSCVEAVTKMKAFTPTLALGGEGRPRFSALPKDLIRHSADEAEILSTQWEKLPSYSLQDFCPDEVDVRQVNLIKFWTSVWGLKNGPGKQIFLELAGFVLAALTVPLSNAVVERLFSIPTLVKSKVRNRLGLEMLDSLLRIRAHLHAKGICCTTFEPSQVMLENFTSRVMYARPVDAQREAEEDEDVGNPEDVPLHFNNIDEDRVPIPQWDEMINLVEEVERELGL